MVERLPKWAENAFAGLCIGANAVVHPPEDDQNGWDALVEMPQPLYPGPPDTHPPASSAYVQVKSVRKRRLTCRITLRNALKAAQSSQPWFVVLIHVDRSTARMELYAIHLWEEFIRRALKEVRICDNKKKPLNRSTLSIRFSPSDRHDDDLVTWMQSEIRAIGPNYESEKISLYRNVGYEDGNGIGIATTSAATADEITDNFIGLGNGLSVSQFTYTPSRFGIASPVPEVEFKGSNGKLYISPNPVDTCEIRLRANGDSYSLPGSVFVAGTPLAKNELKARFATDFLDIVMFLNSDRPASLKMKIDQDARKTLLVLETFAAINDWGHTNKQIDVQVWAKNHRIADGTISVSRNSASSLNWRLIVQALRHLRECVGGNESRITVSLSDILGSSRRLSFFTHVFTPENIRLEFEPTPNTPEMIKSLIYYTCVDVGAFLFFALFRADVFKEILIGMSRRQIEFLKPRCIDSYVIESPSPDQRAQIEKDYHRYHDTCEKDGEHPLGIGDLFAFSESMKNPSQKKG